MFTITISKDWAMCLHLSCPSLFAWQQHQLAQQSRGPHYHVLNRQFETPNLIWLHFLRVRARFTLIVQDIQCSSLTILGGSKNIGKSFVRHTIWIWLKWASSVSWKCKFFNLFSRLIETQIKLQNDQVIKKKLNCTNYFSI